jgi:hypothetical protein
MRLHEQWKSRILDKSLPCTADAMTPTVDLLFDMLINEEIVDFSWMKAEDINPSQVAVSLRGTWSHQDLVAGWDHGYQVAKSALITTGESWEDMLYGLHPGLDEQ